MKKIYENLYQFTTYIPSMDFTIHQYLLTSDPAIVFATGTQKEAAENLATIKEVLGERTVKYIFVSHMESDECGGLPIFHKRISRSNRAMFCTLRKGVSRIWIYRENKSLQ